MSDHPPTPSASQYPAGGYGGLGGYTPQPVRRANGLGTASLVLGILSIVPFWFLVVPGVLAVIFGIIGRRRVKRGEADNGGMALAGLVTGLVGLAIAALFLGLIILHLAAGHCHTTNFTSAGGQTHTTGCS